MTKLIRSVTTIAALFFLTSGFVGAQPPCPTCPPPDPGGDPDKVPFTGLEYLLISGGIYGGIRLLKKADKKANA